MAQKGEGPSFWALPSPHFTTIDLQEKNMKNAAQAEPSAWSLAEEAPEGTDVGSLRSSGVADGAAPFRPRLQPSLGVERPERPAMPAQSRAAP